MTEPLRWGFLGTANIADAVAAAIAASPTNTLRAVASRDAARARAWADARGVPLAFGSYDELLACGEIDALYIPLPNSLHAPWTLRAIDAGLPVLCEKPFAVSAAQAEAVAREAQRAGVLVMEAFAYEFHPLFARLRALVAEGRIGRLVSISSVFTWRLDDRTQIPASAALAGGALMDVGCYGVHAARRITGREPVRAMAMATGNAVDDSLYGLLEFAEGVVATTECSIECEESRRLEIRGERGLLFVDNPWNPPVDQGRIILRSGGEVEEIVTPGGDVYRLEIEHFERAVRGVEPLAHGPLDAVANMRVLDSLAASARDRRVIESVCCCDA
ncbi:MAG: Gfo/Idh/MocA family oxidoreductase [Deltaproteobacteria bacterium]|nr:Gfo/Idh/MocA family oxidoreductase [Deltaproteobacteria bacterium]